MQVLAPAKINLSLKILGRRSDAFHEIETVITPISLYDEIKVEKRSGKTGIVFRCDVPSVPQGDDNLVVRAAKAIAAIGQTGLCRSDFMGISPLVRLARNSKNLLRNSRIRGPDFRQRP